MVISFFFFFNDTATTEIYTLSLHDALPILSTIGLSQIAAAQFLHVYKPRHWINCGQAGPLGWTLPAALGVVKADPKRKVVDRKSTRLNSSHSQISYAVFCLKKKK